MKEIKLNEYIIFGIYKNVFGGYSSGSYWFLAENDNQAESFAKRKLKNKYKFDSYKVVKNKILKKK